MRKRRGETILFQLIILVITASFYFWWDSKTCESKWSLSGLKMSWGVFQGCLVQTSESRWVPSSNVRDIDLPKRQTD